MNGREIQPSAQAWDRLDAMLSVAEEKKTRKPYGLLFIAASILVFVTLGLFLFNQDGTAINTQNTVVETKVDTAQDPTGKIQDPGQHQAVAISEAQQTTDRPQSTANHQGGSIINQEKSNQKVNANQNPNQLIIKDKAIEFQNSSDVAQKNLPQVMEQKPIVIKGNPKTDEVLLADLDQTGKKSTDAKATINVDAKRLLSQVDGEVEYTFREKMLKKINKNYKDIKVALANRNNE